MRGQEDFEQREWSSGLRREQEKEVQLIPPPNLSQNLSISDLSFPLTNTRESDEKAFTLTAFES